jgi:hypothetical protein
MLAYLATRAPGFFDELIEWVVQVLIKLEPCESWVDGSEHAAIFGPASKLWSVVLVNDESHDFDQVIAQIRRATGCTMEWGVAVTIAVDANGRGVLHTSGDALECTTTQQVLAEIQLNASMVNAVVVAGQEAALEAIRWMTDLGVLSNAVRRMLCVALTGEIPDGGWIAEAGAAAAASGGGATAVPAADPGSPARAAIAEDQTRHQAKIEAAMRDPKVTCLPDDKQVAVRNKLETAAADILAASVAELEAENLLPLDLLMLNFVALWTEARKLIRSLLFSTMLLEPDFKPPFAATFVKHYEHVQMVRLS